MEDNQYILAVGSMNRLELLEEQELLNRRLNLVKALLAMQGEREESQGQEELLTGISAPISENDYRYGMLRFPSTSPIAKALEKGSTITVTYGGKVHECTVPKLENYPSQKGRLNGFAKVYAAHPDLAPGVALSASYNPQLRELMITGRSAS